MVSEEVFSPIAATVAIATVVGMLFVILFAELPFAERLRVLVQGHAQKGMFVVAAGAMGSSLYYSEYANFTPCDLCWYQRIAMYPLAVLLLTGIILRFRMDPRLIVVAAGIGLAISIYHYQLQLFPDQAEICTSSVVSCSAKFVDEFGFVTIPFMAGCGFLAILLLQISEWRIDYLFRHDRP